MYFEEGYSKGVYSESVYAEDVYTEKVREKRRRRNRGGVDLYTNLTTPLSQGEQKDSYIIYSSIA